MDNPINHQDNEGLCVMTNPMKIAMRIVPNGATDSCPTCNGEQKAVEVDSTAIEVAINFWRE